MSDKYALAYNTWQEKTEWVQIDKRFDVLLPWGKHRADVLKEYIEHIEAKLDEALRYGRQADATIHNLELKLTDMAVQLAKAESKCRELAAENEGLKAAFDKPQAYLSWHAIPPTWEDPLPCGEYLDVHDGAGHKNSDGTDCWPVYAKPEIKTPATDAFLAEVRASAVEEFVRMADYSESVVDVDVIVTSSSVFTAGHEFAAQIRKGAAL